MKRREFITILGGAAVAWPLALRAQQADRMRRIGLLIQLAEADLEGQARVAAFREGLQKLGWRIGDNLRIGYRWGTSNDERARAAATELLKMAPDAISANSSVALRAAQQATRTVPIVFTTVIEPVTQGFVSSLAHPGGNITGFSYLELSVGGKWLDLLKEIAPRVARVAFMFNPQRGPYSVGMSRFAEEAANKFAMEYVEAPVYEPSEIRPRRKQIPETSRSGTSTTRRTRSRFLFDFPFSTTGEGPVHVKENAQPLPDDFSITSPCFIISALGTS